MPPKKGTSTPNKPPENTTWTLDEGKEMRRDINELQKKMDSMEAMLDTKMDGLKGEIMEVLKTFVTKKTPESENASHEIHDVHSLIPSNLVQFPPHSWRHFKSYMAAQRLF
jgi:hypothetical protein